MKDWQPTERFSFFIYFLCYYYFFFLLEEQKHFIASCYLISCTVMLTHFLYSGIDRALWEETKEKQTEHYVYLWKVKTWWSHYERMVAHRNGFLSFLIFYFLCFYSCFSVKKDKSTFVLQAEMPQKQLLPFSPTVGKPPIPACSSKQNVAMSS